VADTHGARQRPTRTASAELRHPEHILLSVFNTGGSPVTVTNWGIELGKGSGVNMFPAGNDSIGTGVPADVHPGGEPAKF
jgi:hypothetical protein